MTPAEKLAQENAALREKLDEARDEIAFLKREKSLEEIKEGRHRLQRAMKLTRTEANTLLALHHAYPRMIGKYALHEAMYPGADADTEPKIVDVYVCKLRDRLPDKSIDTVWGEGYCLTEAGHALVTAALAGETITLLPPRAPAKQRALTDEQALVIINAGSWAKARQIAAEFGASPGVADRVYYGRGYAHLQPPVAS